MIVLDDCSTDNSLEVIERITGQQARDVRVLANAQNAGSIMRQWLRGVREASGGLIWIAEADDDAAPGFLEQLASMIGPRTLIAFSDSAQIDELGRSIGSSYRPYYRSFYDTAFDQSFTAEGDTFATCFLAIANMILNVSGVLFRANVLRDVLTGQLDELSRYRFAGDWLVYLSICRQSGEVAFCARSLNIHRRHADSATHRTAGAAHLAEIAQVYRGFESLFETTPQISDGAARLS